MVLAWGLDFRDQRLEFGLRGEGLRSKVSWALTSRNQGLGIGDYCKVHLNTKSM